MHPEILASGSLDHEVRIWDANTTECIGSCDFYHPIASIAFHVKGELLVVAFRAQDIHMALQPEKGDFVTNHYIKDKTFTSCCAF